jgi:hypothetical protein
MKTINPLQHLQVCLVFQNDLHFRCIILQFSNVVWAFFHALISEEIQMKT